MVVLSFARKRIAAVCVLATGIVCPCHVLVGLVGVLTGSAVLPPATQDGVHALYVPLAVMSGALLLRRGRAN
jgi:hypothetical protein